jgi:hypothetical protein
LFHHPVKKDCLSLKNNKSTDPIYFAAAVSLSSWFKNPSGCVVRWLACLHSCISCCSISCAPSSLSAALKYWYQAAYLCSSIIASCWSTYYSSCAPSSAAAALK